MSVEHSDNVLASVHVLSNRITRAFESRIEARYRISVAEWRVLLSLFGTSGLTAKEIHEQLGDGQDDRESRRPASRARRPSEAAPSSRGRKSSAAKRPVIKQRGVATIQAFRRRIR